MSDEKPDQSSDRKMEDAGLHVCTDADSRKRGREDAEEEEANDGDIASENMSPSIKRRIEETSCPPEEATAMDVGDRSESGSLKEDAATPKDTLSSPSNRRRAREECEEDKDDDEGEETEGRRVSRRLNDVIAPSPRSDPSEAPIANATETAISFTARPAPNTTSNDETESEMNGSDNGVIEAKPITSPNKAAAASFTFATTESQTSQDPKKNIEVAPLPVTSSSSQERVPSLSTSSVSNSSIATDDPKGSFAVSTNEHKNKIPTSHDSEVLPTAKAQIIPPTNTAKPSRKRFGFWLMAPLLLFSAAIAYYGFDQTSVSIKAADDLFSGLNHSVRRFIFEQISTPSVVCPRDTPHVITPLHPNNSCAKPSKVTLRQFLARNDGFHLAMAPSFFGFFGYFGMLNAFKEDVLVPNKSLVLIPTSNQSPSAKPLLKSVAGASSGALATALLAAGLHPRAGAQFVASLTLASFADPPGFGGIFRGKRVVELILQLIRAEGGRSLLEDAVLPVAVTAFDLRTMRGLILDRGCMAKAAVASATFPGLFQPSAWSDNDESSWISKWIPQRLLVDGGITDPFGFVGLTSTTQNSKTRRIVNIVIGSFGSDYAPTLSEVPSEIGATELVSVSIQNLPHCGPLAMANGPRATEAARESIRAALDIPMHFGREDGHYELHIDASEFVLKQN